MNRLNSLGENRNFAISHLKIGHIMKKLALLLLLVPCLLPNPASAAAKAFSTSSQRLIGDDDDQLFFFWANPGKLSLYQDANGPKLANWDPLNVVPVDIPSKKVVRTGLGFNNISKPTPWVDSYNWPCICRL
jgi:hypothetical protein